jgi:hypothetical protein
MPSRSVTMTSFELIVKEDDLEVVLLFICPTNCNRETHIAIVH